MKILFLSAEVAPYVSVGGLSQVMYYLPRSLSKQGHEVRIFTAKHGAMAKGDANEQPWDYQMDTAGLRVPIRHENGKPETDLLVVEEKRNKNALEHGGVGPDADPETETESNFDGEITCDVLAIEPKKKNDAYIYVLENQEYFGLRANVFGYSDDHTRFALLSKACLEWLLIQYERIQAGEKNVWWPDIINCHDWHMSYFIDLARRDDRYRKVMAAMPIVLTVHNFRYQGNDEYRYMPESAQDNGVAPLAPLTSKLLQRQNALKRGLLFADAITTVSPTHAIEVLTPEYAEGLEDVLEKVRGKLRGIMNGIDTDEFNPATDKLIHKRFGRRWFAAARAENKKDLQRFFKLPVDSSTPLLASVGRLSEQKGWDLLLETLPPLLTERPDVQFIVVGTGDDHYRDALVKLEEQFPKQVGLHLQQDFELPRRVFSGADIVLMPSMFEPGGIVALEALRYGAVPLVRRTGGLNDSIEDFNPITGGGTGFSFTTKNSWALYGAIVEALAIYRHPKLWSHLVNNCLAADFSWDHAARDYKDWYAKAIRQRARSAAVSNVSKR
ncbi:MAG: glycogen/starch synthase [Patescibacteria group bacterium]